MNSIMKMPPGVLPIDEREIICYENGHAFIGYYKDGFYDQDTGELLEIDWWAYIEAPDYMQKGGLIVGDAYWCDRESCRVNEVGCNPTVLDEIKGFGHCVHCGYSIWFGKDVDERLELAAECLENLYGYTKELQHYVADQGARLARLELKMKEV